LTFDVPAGDPRPVERLNTALHVPPAPPRPDSRPRNTALIGGAVVLGLAGGGAGGGGGRRRGPRKPPPGACGRPAPGGGAPRGGGGGGGGGGRGGGGADRIWGAAAAPGRMVAGRADLGGGADGGRHPRAPPQRSRLGGGLGALPPSPSPAGAGGRRGRRTPRRH